MYERKRNYGARWQRIARAGVVHGAIVLLVSKILLREGIMQLCHLMHFLQIHSYVNRYPF